MVSSSVVCLSSTGCNALTLVYLHSRWLKTFSQLISLSIKRHSIHIHVNAAGFTAAHPTDGSAVEGRPASCIVLVNHRRLWIQFGSWFWHLKFHELVGFFKAAKGHGAPGMTETKWLLNPAVDTKQLQSQVLNEGPVKTFPFGNIMLWKRSRHWGF